MCVFYIRDINPIFIFFILNSFKTKILSYNSMYLLQNKNKFWSGILLPVLDGTVLMY